MSASRTESIDRHRHSFQSRRASSFDQSPVMLTGPLSPQSLAAVRGITWSSTCCLRYVIRLLLLIVFLCFNFSCVQLRNFQSGRSYKHNHRRGSTLGQGTVAPKPQLCPRNVTWNCSTNSKHWLIGAKRTVRWPSKYAKMCFCRLYARTLLRELTSVWGVSHSQLRDAHRTH